MFQFFILNNLGGKINNCDDKNSCEFYKLT